MSGPLSFRRIICRRPSRTILPPMTNDFVALFKDTSVVSIIAVVELSKKYQTLSKTSFKYIEIGAGDRGTLPDHVGAAGVLIARTGAALGGIDVRMKGC